MWGRRGNKQLGATPALLGIANKQPLSHLPLARRHTSPLARRPFCSTFHVSRQAAETDKQDAQTGDRDAKTVWQACEPARPIQAEGSMCCALGFTDPTRGTSNVFRLVRVRQGFTP